MPFDVFRSFSFCNITFIPVTDLYRSNHMVHSVGNGGIYCVFGYVSFHSHIVVVALSTCKIEVSYFKLSCKRTRKASDSMLLQNPLQQQKIYKAKIQHKYDIKMFDKTSRLRTDLARYVWANTATKLVKLTVPSLQKSCNQWVRYHMLLLCLVIFLKLDIYDKNNLQIN